MEVFKTRFWLVGGGLDDSMLTDTIWHEGSWWLVASYLQSRATQEKIPERLVRLTGLAHQEVTGERYRFLVAQPIPKSVFEGKTQDGYVVAIHPAVLADTQGPKSIQ